jgi:glycosyltransferase involved in cell wall biosynthesis
MKILIVHQNFPGQFKHLAPALVARKFEVCALHMQKALPTSWQGVQTHLYAPQRGSAPNVHPWVTDFEAKIIRAEACYRAAKQMAASGYVPDVILAHHGWGESLFLKRVWPKAALGIYCEFHYHPNGVDVGFDPEFPARDDGDECRVILKNVNNVLHFDQADGGISPTHWQASTFPLPFRDKIHVVHDGIDTDAIRPNPERVVKLRDDHGEVSLGRRDDVITFVNRNLEPYRGYHIFMRALPAVLAERPRAHVLIVGGNDVSYGARPPDGKTWKDIFIEEVKPKLTQAQWQRVHFLGAIPYDQFTALLQISAAHVYLTYPFVLSWSLLEAMSMACPIVASDTPPLREAIDHNMNGLLTPFFDVQKLSESIVRLLENRTLGAQLGQMAREKAVARYDLQKVCLPDQISWLTGLKT